jgi:hypothetical protein
MYDTLSEGYTKLMRCIQDTRQKNLVLRITVAEGRNRSAGTSISQVPDC